MEITKFSKKYFSQISQDLKKSLKLSNNHMIPQLEKIVLSMKVGTKSMEKDSKYVDVAEKFITDIAGQKPAYTTMPHSISGFKVREGMKLGYKVTLRKDRMYSFLAKFVAVVLPRIKNFQGIFSKSIDHQGNLNFGIADCGIFPEILAKHEMLSYEYKIGISVTIVTSTKNREHAKVLFEKYDIPFYN